MRHTAHQTRENRTITIDFHNEATYVQRTGQILEGLRIDHLVHQT